MGKFELHVHTAENDKCALESAKNIVRLYKDAGYEGLVITDHYFKTFFEWFGDEFDRENHHEVIDRWLKGYRAAREEGEACGMTVLLGAEVRFNGPNINDYLVYGLTEEFLYNAPFLNELPNLDALLEILPPDALVVQAHPFRDNMTVKNPENLFGIEVYNGGTQPIRNRLARTFAEHYGKAMTSGSDFHSKHALARGGIVSNKPIKTMSDLLETLKSGSYTLIET